MQHPYAALQRRDYAAFLDACGTGGVGVAAWAPYAPALGMAAVEQLDQAQGQRQGQGQAGESNQQQRDKLRLREALSKLSDPFSSAVQYAESARSTGLSAALQVVEEGRRGAQDLSTADVDDFDAADTMQRMLIAALQLRQLLVQSSAAHASEQQGGDVAMVAASTVYGEVLANELTLVVPMLTQRFPHLFPIGLVAKALLRVPGGAQLVAALAANTCVDDGEAATAAGIRAVVDAAFGHLNTLECGIEVAAAAMLSRLCLLAPPAMSMVRAHLVEKQLLPEMVLQLTSDLNDELEFLTSVVFGSEAKRDWLLAHLASSQRATRGPSSSQSQPRPILSSPLFTGPEPGPDPQIHSKRGRPDIIPLGRTQTGSGTDQGLPDASPLAKRPRLGGPGTLSAPLPRTSQTAHPVSVPVPNPIPAVSRTSSSSSSATNIHAVNISLRVREALLVDAQRSLELNQERVGDRDRDRDRDMNDHVRKRLTWSERALSHLRLFCVLVGAGGLRPSGEEMSMWLTAVATARDGGGRVPPASPQHPQQQEEERLLSAGTLRLSLSFLCLSQGLTAPSFRPLLQRAVGRIIYHYQQPVLGNGESQAHALPQAPPQAEAHAQVQAQAREQQVLMQGQGFVKETAEDEEEEARQLSVWLGTQLYLRQFPAIADAVRGALGVHVRVPSTALRDVAEVASAAGLLAPDDLAATAASIHARGTESADYPAAQMALVALRQLLEAGVLHQPSKADIAGFAVWQLLAQKTASMVNPQLLAFLRALASQDTHVVSPPGLESLLHAEVGNVGTDRVRVLAACYTLRVEEAARTGCVRIADVGVWDGVLTTLPVMHCLRFMRRSGTVYQELYLECLQLATELLPEQASAPALERLQAELRGDRNDKQDDDNLNVTLIPDAIQRALSDPLSDPASTSSCLRALINHTKRTYDPKGSLPLHSSVMESISPLLLQHNKSEKTDWLKTLFVEWWLALPMQGKVPLFPCLMAALGVDGGNNNNNSNNNNNNNGDECSLEKMRLSPLRVLACDARCFRIAPVLELLLEVYGMLLAMNRRLAMAARRNKYSSRLVCHTGFIIVQPSCVLAVTQCSAVCRAENGNSSIVTPSNTSSSLLLQASAGVQMLLEVLIELGGGGEGGGGEVPHVQQHQAEEGQTGEEAESRENILKFLDRAFAQEPLLLKLVHFQGFDLSLVAPLAHGAPSVRRMCVDFLPELLAHSQPERQVLGVALAGALKDACTEALAQQVVAFVRSLMSKPSSTEHIQKMLLPLASCALAVPKVAMECIKIFQECAEVSRALQPDAPPRDPGLHAAAAAAAMDFFERRAAT